MKVQFRCCLCGQTNVSEVDPATGQLPRKPGFFARLFGQGGKGKQGRPTGPAAPKFMVHCNFCNQKNSISPPRQPPRGTP